jgi:hypothetical protein
VISNSVAVLSLDPHHTLPASGLGFGQVTSKYPAEMEQLVEVVACGAGQPQNSMPNVEKERQAKGMTMAA